MTIGFSLYLDLQSIWIMGFGFPTIGGSMLSSPNTFLFPQTPLLNSQSWSLSPLEWLISSLSVLSKIANPLFSLNPSIYSFRLVEILWLLPSISVNEGPIPLSLGGYSGGWNGSGIEIDSHLQKACLAAMFPKAISGSPIIILLSNHTPGQDKFDQMWFTFDIHSWMVPLCSLGLQWVSRGCLDQGLESNREGIKVPLFWNMGWPK